MSLRLGVDAWNLPHDRRGIGRYVREIIGAWIRFGAETVNVELVIPERNVLFARGRYLRELAGNVPVRGRGRERGLDVIWFPWNGMSWIPATPAVATLHDASLFRMPPKDPVVADREHRPFRTAAARARRIITDSQFSKDELVRYLELEPAQIDVIPLGVSEVFRNRPASQLERGRYLVFVGDIEARKGLDTVTRALGRLPEAMRSNLELKVVGDRNVREESAAVGVRMSRTGWVDDRALADLYRNALALVYASEYEGYGLPIIEAMACGTPVIAAATAPSREAGGEAAIYFPQGDAEALASVIESLSRCSREEFMALASAGRSHTSGRTWERTARLTLSAIEACM
jgi:glycosyltransferase involved in cell wall biosynthesis